MRVIGDEHVIYRFDPAVEPVAEVEPGETVTFRVQDCFSNRVGPGTDPLESLRWTEINPATGPVAVRGAQPGDTLAVDILEIRLQPRGIIVAAPGFGAVGHLLEDPEIAGLRLDGGIVRFGDLELPADPMVGVIGTAPAQGGVACGLPGPHGGNLNTGLVRAGARVYLPVHVPGGNLALGDLHGLMADGELGITGLECAGEVTARACPVAAGRRLGPGLAAESGRSPAGVRAAARRELEFELAAAPGTPGPAGPVVIGPTSEPEGSLPRGPVIRTADVWATVASGPTLDDAAGGAAENMFWFLRRRSDLSPNQIAMLLSLAADLRISQVVNPLKTARVEFPRYLADRLGVTY